MTMMTAGRPAAYAVAEPFLKAMSGKVYKLGESAGADRFAGMGMTQADVQDKDHREG